MNSSESRILRRDLWRLEQGTGGNSCASRIWKGRWKRKDRVMVRTGRRCLLVSYLFLLPAYRIGVRETIFCKAGEWSFFLAILQKYSGNRTIGRNRTGRKQSGRRDTMGRYERNGLSVSPQETETLHGKHVCVVGCGGLGGYLIELLGRVGVGSITAVDADVFEETNLNRQLLSDTEVMGRKKAEIAAERMHRVNPEISLIPVCERLTRENAEEILRGQDLVLDAVDSISSRLLLEDCCEQLHIPLIHGAIGGWYAQVSVIWPGDRTLHSLYETTENRGEEATLGNPSFTPALAASIQTAEAIKLLLGKGELLRRSILSIDLLEHRYEVIPLD